MSKVIFTADDYGVVPAIDEGIIKAVKARKINSVAAFSNHEGAVDSIKRLVDEGAYADLEVGCHLTITSGKPLIPEKLKKVTQPNGFFRTFTQMRRPAPNLRVKEIVELENELTAQIEHLLNNGIDVKHLSSHHNALYFFEDYADTLFAVANKYNLPVRSPINQPDLQQNLYVSQLVLRWFDNMTIKDRKHIRNFMRSPVDYLESRQESKPKMPSQFNSIHYGPVPMPLFDLDQDKIRKEVEDKVDCMSKELIKLTEQNQVVEFVFHIIDDNYDELDDFTKQTKNNGYSGVDEGYFNARIAEYRALQQLILPTEVAFTSW